MLPTLELFVDQLQDGRFAGWTEPRVRMTEDTAFSQISCRGLWFSRLAAVFFDCGFADEVELIGCSFAVMRNSWPSMKW